MTDREQVIELIARHVSGLEFWDEAHQGVRDSWCYRVEQLLDFRQPCQECEGTGLIADPNHISREYDDVGIECPDCKGTGLERVLFTKEDIKEAGYVKLDKDQSVPKELVSCGFSCEKLLKDWRKVGTE